MPREIERKFLVKRDLWKPTSPGVAYRQGYLPTAGGVTVRVRLEGDQARLTIKGPAYGVVRSEYEYPIPYDHALELLSDLCAPPHVEKDRYLEIHGGKVWEIDVFHGLNDGLIVAEIELSDADEAFERPTWLDHEVSEDRRYANSELAKRPFSTWSPEER